MENSIVLTKTEKRKAKAKNDIDLLMLLKEVWSKFWIILLVSLFAGGSSFLVAKLIIEPTYRSSFTAYINNNKDETLTSSLNSSDIIVSQQLVRTYSQIIKCRFVINTAAKESGINKSYGELSKMVKTEISDETGIITVNVDSLNPSEAYKFATNIKDNALRYTAEIVEGSTMRIIDDPVISTAPYGPNYFRYALLAAVGAFLLSVLVICIIRILNDKIAGEEEFAERYDIPVVGVIPDVINVGKNKMNYYYRKSDNKEKQ